MSDDRQSRFETDLTLDVSVGSASREGLTGTARAGVYEKTRDPEAFTVAPDSRPMEQQPKWRRDFAIDWPLDQYVARRDFAKFLVLTSGAFAFGQGWVAVQNLVRKGKTQPRRLKIASVEDIPPGTVKMFHFPGENDPCLLIRTEDGALVAYSQKCTHLSCAVVPKVAEGVLHCPCHEGLFDLGTGRNIAGPPTRPLPRIELEMDGNDVYAVSVRERTV